MVSLEDEYELLVGDASNSESAENQNEEKKVSENNSFWMGNWLMGKIMSLRKFVSIKFLCIAIFL